MIKKLAIISLSILLLGCSQQEKEKGQSIIDNTYRPSGFHVFINHGEENIPVSLVKEDTTYHLFYTTGTNEWGHLTSSNLVSWTPQVSFPLSSKGYGQVVLDQYNFTGLDAPWNIILKDGDELNLTYSKDGLEWTEYINNPILTAEGTPSITWSSDLEQWILTLANKSEVSILTSANLVDWSEPTKITLDSEVSKATLSAINEKWTLLSYGKTLQYQTGSFDGNLVNQMFLPDHDVITIPGPNANSFTTLNNAEETILIAKNNEPGSQFPTFTTPLSLSIIDDQLRLFPAGSLQKEIVGKRRAKLSKLKADGPAWFNFGIDQEFEQLEIVISDSSSDLKILWNKLSGEVLLSGSTIPNVNTPSSFSTRSADQGLKVDLLIDHKTVDIFFNDGEYFLNILAQPRSFFSNVEVYLDGEIYDARGVLYDIGI